MRTSYKRIKLDRNCGDIADDLDSREWEVVGGGVWCLFGGVGEGVGK